MKLVCCFSVIIACSCIKKKENKKGGEGDVIYEDPEKNNEHVLKYVVKFCFNSP